MTAQTVRETHFYCSKLPETPGETEKKRPLPKWLSFALFLMKFKNFKTGGQVNITGKRI